MKYIFLKYKTSILVYFVLLLITLSLAYTSTFNPFNLRIMNVDTSIYVSIAQGITRGQVLYRDLADNKGPLLYFMSVPGIYFGGITGLWITEILIMYIVFYFMYKTALLFVSYKTSLLAVFAVSLAMHPFYYVHAGTEIYSLPFLVISLYIFTKHYITNKNPRLFEILILGICFACSVMIRLNMFMLWAGFCLFIFLESIISRRYIELGKYILFFSLGLCIITLPIYLYIKHYDLFYDFYIQVISGGITRGFRVSFLQEFIHNFYIVINRSLSFIPLAAGIICFFSNHRNINKYYFLAYIFSYILSIVFLSFSWGNSHYNLILIPFFVPAIAWISDSLLCLFSKNRHKYIALIFFFCIIFSEGIIRFSFYFFFNFETGIQLVNAGKFIDENTGTDDKIINLGWNGYIYPFTKRGYASKFIFQSEAFDHIPNAQEEFINDIINNKPRLITIYTAGDNQFKPGWHEEIYLLLYTHYKLIKEDYGFKFYLCEY